MKQELSALKRVWLAMRTSALCGSWSKRKDIDSVKRPAIRLENPWRKIGVWEAEERERHQNPEKKPGTGGAEGYRSRSP